ncbi:MAG: PKD domain-containing protein, partial [Ekhidna sp.]|nr:PKD domain-containing protein [Ekhidna sp.]
SESRGADLEIVGNTIYASTGIFNAGKLFKSEDDGVTWQEITPDSGLQRIEIGTHPNHPNTVYAVASSGSNIAGFFKSFDKGETWSPVTVPPYTEQSCDESTTNDFARGQAWYDLIIGVDPTNRNVLTVGGIDIIKSSDAGETWDLISYWTGACDVYVHADQHNILWRPGYDNEVIAATDGGLYYTRDFNTPIDEGGPNFVDRNFEYNVAQFYSVAMENVAGSNYMLGGTQDNGSHQFFNIGINSTNEITGGDGSFCFIDQDDSNIQITSTVFNSYIFTQDGWENTDRVNVNGAGRFINPADYSSSTNTLFAAGNDNSIIRYVVDDAIEAEQLDVSLDGGQISALHVSPYSDDLMVVGTGGGQVYLLSDINAAPVALNLDNGQFEDGIFISSVTFGSDENHVIVTASNYGVISVYETLDRGTTWSNKEGNLPDFPVRWALPNPNNYDEVLLATEMGVWYADDFSADSPTWVSLSDGLANVRCDMLQYRAVDGLVAVATHGRGMYTSDVFATQSYADFASQDIAYANQSIAFEDGSVKADSYLWDFGDGTTSTVSDPVHTYDNAGVFTVRLTLNGDENVVREKELRVLPKVESDFTLAKGGDFETNLDLFNPVTISGTGWELGSSTISGKDGTNSGVNAWVTGLEAAEYESNGEAYLYTPLFDFNLSGDYTLEFFTKYELEDTWEGFIVEYTTDFGKSWVKLGDFLDEENWYNQTAIGNAIAFTPGEALFSGNTGGVFVRKGITFSDLSTEEVGFRFVFKTDPNTEFAGIAIDDFRIIPPSETSVALSFEAGSAGCVGDPVTFTNQSTGAVNEYTWNFGSSATPATAVGFGPHDVIFSSAGMQTITLTAGTNSGDVVETLQFMVSEIPASAEATTSSLELCSGEDLVVDFMTSASVSYFLYSLDGDSIVGEGVDGTGDMAQLSTTLDVGSFSFRILARNEGGCESFSVTPIVADVAQIQPQS